MNILIAVDDTKIAEDTFDWYFEHAHQSGNHVLVLHVEPQKKLLSTPSSSKTTEVESKYLKKLESKKCNGKFLADKSGEKPGPVIISQYVENNIDMIVIGSRGLGMIKRTMGKSVSDYVVNRCEVPCIICKM